MPPPESIPEPTPDAPAHGITFGAAVRVWLRVAARSFGGPAGQIGVIHRIVVEEKRWISESRFLHALNYCMLLPGPEATQLVTYIGWLLHKTIGGLVAGILFILPGFLSILILSYLYAGCQDFTPVQALFFGLKPAVFALVIEAVLRIGKRALKNRVMVALAGTAFVALFFFNVPFPAIILSAGLIGYLGGKRWPDIFHVVKGHGGSAPTPNGSAGSPAPVVDALLDTAVPEHTKPALGRTIRVAFVWLLLWFGPMGALIALYGLENIFVQESFLFSKAAVVTFGGAYAVLPYIQQQAVGYGWLTPPQMIDGLGMAETTPGPLIQVVQFVGFMGAYSAAPALHLHPMLAGTLAAILTTWMTFVPCFLWIFVGAPYIEALRGSRALSTALSAITAAVVGVILNLAVWFAVHSAFGKVEDWYWEGTGIKLPNPDWTTVNVGFVVLGVAALIAMLRFKVGMLWALAGSAVLGMVYYAIWVKPV